MAKKFIIVDSAQVEARVLAWLAGQDDLVQGFANNEDIYSEFATGLFGIMVRKPRKSDPKVLHDYYEIKRGFGKDAILGCGFGMGANKFYSRCLENDSLRPLFDSGTYDFNFINKLIKTYRGKYTRITDFWTRVEKAFRWVIKYPHETITVPSDIEWAQNDCPQLTFYTEDGAVMIRLPSSRCLRYRHPGIDLKRQIRYRWGPLWGGSITENIVQSVARDLLGYWILKCEKAGLHIVLHVHDETVGLVEEEVAEESFNKMVSIVCSGPTWSEGLPLGYDGFIKDSYAK